MVRNAIAPPSTNGNIISNIVFRTPSTTSNFHKATTRSAVNTIWDIIFPFVLGGAIAFLTNVPMSFLEKKIFEKVKKLTCVFQ